MAKETKEIAEESAHKGLTFAPEYQPRSKMLVWLADLKVRGLDGVSPRASWPKPVALGRASRAGESLMLADFSTTDTIARRDASGSTRSGAGATCRA